MVDVVRFPPSPTGLFHVGSARTAYFNYLTARSSGSRFVFRLDDTDVERNKDEYTQVILDSLDWLGLEYDEIYYQSQRTELYQKTAKSLLECGKAVELGNGAIALSNDAVRLPESFLDTIAGNIPITKTNWEQINKGLVLLRGGDKLGQPTYQFASVVDDYYMGITHVLRGVDHISNTPKQIAIWGALGDKELPKWTHIGLIFKDGKKLSKRDGAASLLTYKEDGYSAKAILDWLLRMSWHLKVPRGSDKETQRLANEPISKARAIEIFNKGTLKNSPCQFDMNKLNWLQKRYSK